MSKKNIRFILNPFSGIGAKRVIPTLLREQIDQSKIEYDLQYTEGPGHAKVLTDEALERGYFAVVAVGGDGSINEVGSRLIGTQTALGMIPGGSGNGIARSFGVSMKHKDAIAAINNLNTFTIDTGELDGRPFIGVAGLGFDAHISERFLNRKVRGKMSYGLVMMKEYRHYEAFDYCIDDCDTSKEAFVLAFANTTQYGNNAFIAPMAEFTDGRLEMVRIKKVRKRMIPEMVMRLFSKRLDESSFVDMTPISHARIRHSAQYAHVDGEPFEVSNEFEVRIRPKSLLVIK